jgi:AraC-like DNA-binding protein
MGYSTQYFCQIFKTAMKMRPIEYLNVFRVNKSKTLLINHPELSLNEIAKMTGYDSESYFSTVFRNQEKMSPRSFRELNRLH